MFAWHDFSKKNVWGNAYIATNQYKKIIKSLLDAQSILIKDKFVHNNIYCHDILFVFI
jgi:hypothetical protein